MTKQFSILVALSILLVVFASYAQQVFIYIDLLYTYINVMLTGVFSSGATGIKIQKITTLMVLPLLITGVPASAYWLYKKKLMPYFYHVLWVVWLIILISHVMIR